MTQADDQVAFLKARLDEQERDAGDWHNQYDCDLGQLETYGRCSCDGPARELRKVAALRAIMTEHEHRTESDRKFGFGPGSSPCRTLRALALIWSNHPDYRPAWKP